MHTKRITRAAVAAGVCAVPAMALLPSSARAATEPITPAITVTPSVTTVGGQVTVVASATNTGAATGSAAMGIENHGWRNEKIKAVSGRACTPRNVIATIYCSNLQLAPGATMKITLTLTATAAGTDNFTVYSRITGSDDFYAYGTLTVS